MERIFRFTDSFEAITAHATVEGVAIHRFWHFPEPTLESPGIAMSCVSAGEGDNHIVVQLDGHNSILHTLNAVVDKLEAGHPAVTPFKQALHKVLGIAA